MFFHFIAFSDLRYLKCTKGSNNKHLLKIDLFHVHEIQFFYYRKLRGEFLSQGDDNDQQERKAPIQLPQEEERSPPPSRRLPSPPRREPSPPPREPTPPPREPSPPPRQPSPPPREPSPPPREPSPPRQPSPPPDTQNEPRVKNVLAEGMPKGQDSNDEQDADVWEDGRYMYY